MNGVLVSKLFIIIFVCRSIIIIASRYLVLSHEQVNPAVNAITC